MRAATRVQFGATATRPSMSGLCVILAENLAELFGMEAMFALRGHIEPRYESM